MLKDKKWYFEFYKIASESTGLFKTNGCSNYNCKWYEDGQTFRDFESLRLHMIQVRRWYTKSYDDWLLIKFTQDGYKSMGYMKDIFKR